MALFRSIISYLQTVIAAVELSALKPLVILPQIRAPTLTSGERRQEQQYYLCIYLFACSLKTHFISKKVEDFHLEPKHNQSLHIMRSFRVN